jgi:hypothetical protein
MEAEEGWGKLVAEPGKRTHRHRGGRRRAVVSPPRVFPLFFLLSFSSFLLRECNGTGFLHDGLFSMGRLKEFSPRETLQAHVGCDELQARTLPSRGEMCSTQHFSHKDKLWTYLLALFEQVVIFVIFSNLTWFDLN